MDLRHVGNTIIVQNQVRKYAQLFVKDERFQNLDLRGRDFSGDSFIDVDFQGSDLRGANFAGATFFDSKLQASDFRNARVPSAASGELMARSISSLAYLKASSRGISICR